jgi:hypothetical protein
VPARAGVRAVLLAEADAVGGVPAGDDELPCVGVVAELDQIAGHGGEVRVVGADDRRGVVGQLEGAVSGPGSCPTRAVGRAHQRDAGLRDKRLGDGAAFVTAERARCVHVAERTLRDDEHRARRSVPLLHFESRYDDLDHAGTEGAGAVALLAHLRFLVRGHAHAVHGEGLGHGVAHAAPVAQRVRAGGLLSVVGHHPHVVVAVRRVFGATSEAANRRVDRAHAAPGGRAVGTASVRVLVVTEQVHVHDRCASSKVDRCSEDAQLAQDNRDEHARLRELHLAAEVLGS